MTYRYNPPTPRPARETHLDIESEFGRWCDQADANVVTDYAIPRFLGHGNQAARVSFTLRGTPVTVEITQWDYETNLRCAWLVIRDMRLAEARGAGEALARAGATAYGLLEAPRQERDPYEVLGVRPDTDIDVIEAVYRMQAKRQHPDSGGSVEAMTAINRAIERIREEKSR